MPSQIDMYLDILKVIWYVSGYVTKKIDNMISILMDSKQNSAISLNSVCNLTKMMQMTIS